MTTSNAARKPIEKPKHDKKVSGLFEGPHWCPQYSDFNDKRQKELLAKLPEGSHADTEIRGKVVVFNAWNRDLYGIEVETPKGPVIFHAPEHAALYGALGKVTIGADCYIALEGRGKAKPNQQAPLLYVVIPYDEKHILSSARKDALKVQRKDDDGAPAGKGAIDDGAPPIDAEA